MSCSVGIICFLLNSNLLQASGKIQGLILALVFDNKNYILSYMKIILFLFFVTAHASVMAESIPLTPESVSARAKKIGTAEEEQLLIDEVLASKQIENVKALFHEQGGSRAFGDAIEALEDSDYKDQIMFMIMNERWPHDVDSTEGSGSPGPIALCMNFLAKRAPELNSHTGPHAEFRFFFYKTRKEIAKAFQDKIEKEKIQRATTPNPQGAAAPLASSAQSPKESEPQKSIATSLPEQSGQHPALLYGLPAAILTILALLYFVVKQRGRQPT
jgi:hypothetical protein